MSVAETTVVGTGAGETGVAETRGRGDQGQAALRQVQEDGHGEEEGTRDGRGSDRCVGAAQRQAPGDGRGRDTRTKR